MSESQELDRRRAICKACIGCLGAATVATVGYPAVMFMCFPTRLAVEKPLEIELAGLVPGQAVYAQVRSRPIVVLAGESGPCVLSASCTHLGCSVIWDAGDSVFRCPCHGAVFDGSGAVVSGPVNVPLKAVPFEVKDGRIIVS